MAAQHGATLPPNSVYDVIIGSDMICCTEDAHGVAATLARHLRRPASPSSGADTYAAAASVEGGPLARFHAHGGVALVLIPPPFTRYGVDALACALEQRGLIAQCATIDPIFTLPAYYAASSTDGATAEQQLGPTFQSKGRDLPQATSSSSSASAGSDASGIVVAGGRERELQLWVISWPERRD